MSLYKPPDWFVERLHRESDGRIRIRWSIAKGEWHIEQKVGRAALPPFRISEVDDTMIRARDGYWFILAVRPGNFMPCPKCGLKISVPELHFGEAICYACKAHGRDGRYTAAYFPLGARLLEHLRYIDTDYGGLERQIADVDNANAALIEGGVRKRDNTIEAVNRDYYPTLAGIQSVGYTGKDSKG